jgi:hypothetical protein
MNTEIREQAVNVEPSASNATPVDAKVQRLSHEQAGNKGNQRPVPVEIVVSGSFRVLFDDEDYQKILATGCPLYIRPNGFGNFYVTLWKDNRHILIHRFILGATDGRIVDHANRNTLDNRKTNLRLCTKSENAVNSTRVRGRYGRGVSKDGRGRRRGYRAEIRASGKRLYLGSFATAEEAQEAYRAASIRLHGEFSIYG